MTKGRKLLLLAALVLASAGGLLYVFIWSIMLLGEIGPAASNAVPLLEAKAKVGGVFAQGIQKAAREALSRITNAP